MSMVGGSRPPPFQTLHTRLCLGSGRPHLEGKNCAAVLIRINILLNTPPIWALQFNLHCLSTSIGNPVSRKFWNDNASVMQWLSRMQKLLRNK